jgi:hypothetical protein
MALPLKRDSRNTRRRKRATLFSIEFSLASLNLSSELATVAVTELKGHEQTIKRTAEMSFEDAKQVHDQEIAVHQKNLQHLQEKLKASGTAPSHDHQAMVHP